MLRQEPPADEGSSSCSQFKVYLQGWEYRALGVRHKSALGFTGRVDSPATSALALESPAEASPSPSISGRPEKMEKKINVT